MPRLILGAVALSFVLAGCGGEPEAPPDPTATTSGASTTPTTPPTPSAPALPEAATANTKAGAIAFVQHYVEVQNYASSSGDTQPLKTLATKECDSCRGITSVIDRVYRAQGRIEGDGWEIIEASNAQISAGPADLHFVDVKLNVSPQVIYASPTASPSNFVGNPSRLMTFGLSRTADGWRVSQIVASEA